MPWPQIPADASGLDYNLQYSHYNSTVPLQLQADQNRQVAAIRQMASQYGLFFFTGGMMHWMVSLQRWCSVSLMNTTLR